MLNRPFSRRLFSGAIGSSALLATAAVAQTGSRVETRRGDPVNAREFGAVGDGITDDTVALQDAITAAFGNAASPIPNTGYRMLVIPEGNYRITSPLQIKSMSGGVITGAGRFATQIINAANGTVFKTNGCQYSRFENMLVGGGGSAAVFDLDFDGKGTPLQSNTFFNMFFQNGAVGLRIGNSQFMGSENLILNCFFIGQTRYGLQTCNFNALQNTVVGGNFQTCGVGIYVQKGSVPLIASVGFQESASWDIQVDNSANDCTAVIGCRTESLNFAKFTRQPVTFSSCNQTNSTSGIFVQSQRDGVCIDNCISIAGQVRLGNGGSVRLSQFGRSDWCDSNTNAYCTRVTAGKTTVGSGTGTPIVYEFGYFKSGFFTPIGPPALGVTALRDAATVITDATMGPFFTLTLRGNRTLANPVNMRAGETYTWILAQDWIGSRTLGYGNLFTWPGGTAPALSTEAGAVDVLKADYDGNKLRAQLTKAFS